MNKVALVVDDMRSMRKLVSSTLEHAGFEVLEAANGKEALETLETRVVQLVIVDLNMPVMGGLDFIRAMRQLPEQRKTPAVLLTTELAAEKKAEARAAGATGWIVKPFNPRTIAATVERLLG